MIARAFGLRPSSLEISSATLGNIDGLLLGCMCQILRLGLLYSVRLILVLYLGAQRAAVGGGRWWWRCISWSQANYLIHPVDDATNISGCCMY